MSINRYSDETVLVTGGLGFVGRNLVDGLIVNDAKKIYVVDDCSNSSPVLPSHWAGKVEHIIASVAGDEWLELMPKVGIVFHLACKTLLECHDDPHLDMQINAGSTLRALEKIRRLQGTRPTFVYTSSACVYGITPDYAIDESYPTSPSSPYGVSKLTGENYVKLYSETYGLNTVTLRLSNVYGPGQTPTNPYCGVIGKFTDQVKSGKPLTVVGDGTQKRDFTYVGDTIEAILLSAKNPNAKGKIYNVALGQAVSINDIVNIIRKTYPEATVTYIPQRQIDDVTYRQLKSESIGTDLGWVGKTSVQLGLPIILSM